MYFLAIKPTRSSKQTSFIYFSISYSAILDRCAPTSTYSIRFSQDKYISLQLLLHYIFIRFIAHTRLKLLCNNNICFSSLKQFNVTWYSLHNNFSWRASLICTTEDLTHISTQFCSDYQASYVIWGKTECSSSGCSLLNNLAVSCENSNCISTRSILQ